MSALERFALQVAALVIGCAAAWFWHVAEVASAREDGDKAGYSRAVEAGKAKFEAERERNLKSERDLREDNRRKDAAAQKTEQTYAENLADAQRRVRAGIDSLRCPAASPIQPATAPADRPVAAQVPVDGLGAELVPEVAADVLGLAAASASLVRKYDELVNDRYESCRAMNNAASAGSVAP